MKISNIKSIIKEEVSKILKEDATWPIGHFEVQNAFTITPGGGWTVSFKKGDIIRVEDASKDGYPGIQKMQKWDALKGDWVKKAPPMSGMEVFPIDSFSGSRGWVDLFTKNTKAISQSEANSKAKSMPKEVVLTAVEGARMLAKLPSRQQVKITLV